MTDGGNPEWYDKACQIGGATSGCLPRNLRTYVMSNKTCELDELPMPQEGRKTLYGDSRGTCMT